MNEYRRAFRITWDIISILVLLGFLILLFVPQAMILKSLPICEWQQTYQKSCFLCGMGRALVFIAHGQVQQAITLNWLCIPLLVLLLLNEVVWIRNGTPFLLKR